MSANVQPWVVWRPRSLLFCSLARVWLPQQAGNRPDHASPTESAVSSTRAERYDSPFTVYGSLCRLADCRGKLGSWLP